MSIPSSCGSLVIYIVRNIRIWRYLVTITSKMNDIFKTKRDIFTAIRKYVIS